MKLRLLALWFGVGINFIWSKDITSKISCIVGLTIINIVIPFSGYYLYTCIGLFTPVCLQPLSLIQEFKGTVSRYIDKNRTGACGLGRNRHLLRHTELVFLSTVCARRVVLVLFTNMDAVN